MAKYDLAEQLVCHIAREFGPEDNFAVVAMGIVPLIGTALGVKLYAPGIIMLGMRGGLGNKGLWSSGLRMPPIPWPEDLTIAPCSRIDVFEAVAGGKWCIFMGPVQLDKFGNANLSVIGDKKNPKVALQGSRGMPDNTVNAPREYYWVPQHTTRIFVDTVDFISGVGYTPARLRGELKWGAPEKVFSNLGIFDFDKKTGRMRLKAVWTGVSPQQVVENTGFELIMPSSVPEAGPPTDEELSVLRGEIDPMGIRKMELGIA